jgi:hypothetical protein
MFLFCFAYLDGCYCSFVVGFFLTSPIAFRPKK